MSIRFSPMRRKGPRGVLTDRIRTLTWPAILRRSGHACEACGARDVPIEWAHCFGRPSTGAGLGAWANSEHLTAALCRSCHDAIDRHLDPDLARRLRRDALHRLADACPESRPTTPIERIHVFTGSLDEARQLVVRLEADGWTYDADLQKPRRLG